MVVLKKYAAQTLFFVPFGNSAKQTRNRAFRSLFPHCIVCRIRCVVRLWCACTELTCAASTPSRRINFSLSCRKPCTFYLYADTCTHTYSRARILTCTYEAQTQTNNHCVRTYAESAKGMAACVCRCYGCVEAVHAYIRLRCTMRYDTMRTGCALQDNNKKRRKRSIAIYPFDYVWTVDVYTHTYGIWTICTACLYCVRDCMSVLDCGAVYFRVVGYISMRVYM